MNELSPEPSHEGEAGMVVMKAIKSMCNAPLDTHSALLQP